MNVVLHDDWLNNDIPNKSINLIIADPPYFEVKGEFDFIWPDFKSYLQDVEKWAVECKRVLADNGSLLWWGHAKKIAYSQVIFDKYFKLENNLVWHKIDAQTNKINPIELRTFRPVTERLLFYSNEKIETSFSIEIKKGMKKYNLRENDFRKLKVSKNGNNTGWCSNIILGKSIPIKEDWILICSLIRKENNYEQLLQEYASLKRPFDLSLYNLNDIIPESQESHISQDYDHETIKPLTLTKKLIQTTTRKGDTVLIPFGGSGTDVEACIDTCRRYICYEIKEKHYNTIKSRENKALSQPELF